MKLTREKLVEMAETAHEEWKKAGSRCPHAKCPYLNHNAVYCEMCHMIEVVLREYGEEGEVDG